MALLRRRAVEAHLGKKRSALYDDIQRGLLPPGIRLGARAVGWLKPEIEAIVAARVAGCGPVEIKLLVARLVAERANALVALRPDAAVQRKPGK